MVEYPLEFDSDTEKLKQEEGWKLETGEGLEIEMTVPEEFGGDSENPSPEDLFSASLHTCMIATYSEIAERKNLDFDKIEGESSVSLDRGGDSRPVMKKGEIRLKVYGVNDESKAREVGKAAKKNCFIHNSVETDLETNIVFLPR